jgi:hypothetical protein
MYVTYISNCKYMGWRNYEQTIFMINCYKEMLRINPDAVYYIAFNFIREISVYLKSLMTTKNINNIHKLYNWQLVNTLRLWARLALEPQLSDLIYPIVQVIDGLINLFFTVKYYPLILHLVSLLNEISAASHTAVPVFKTLIKML